MRGGLPRAGRSAVETMTPRQLQVLRFIRDYRIKTGCSPTMQEIGDALNLTKVTAFEHVVALQKKGLLTRGAKNKARSLQVSPDCVFEDEGPTRLPLAGRIAAGRPVETIEDRSTVDLAELFPCGQNTFVLEVTGDSMIDEQIRQGDLVVCEGRNTARNGQIVAALLDSGETTLKKFYKEAKRFRLQPANAAYEPIYVDQVNIQGVVIGVIRRL
jgi:repressor LexA